MLALLHRYSDSNAKLFSRIVLFGFLSIRFCAGKPVLEHVLRWDVVARYDLRGSFLNYDAELKEKITMSLGINAKMPNKDSKLNYLRLRSSWTSHRSLVIPVKLYRAEAYGSPSGR